MNGCDETEEHVAEAFLFFQFLLVVVGGGLHLNSVGALVAAAAGTPFLQMPRCLLSQAVSLI